MAGGDRAGPVELFGQHRAGQEMRPGHPPEREGIPGARRHLGGETFRPADQEADPPAEAEPAFQQCRQFRAVRRRPAGVERDREGPGGQGGEQGGAFAALDLGRAAARLG